MMPVIRTGGHRWLWVISSLCLVTSSASAEQSWLPIISTAEAAPIESPENELEQGWYPVVIHPPRRSKEPADPVSIGTAVAQAGSAQGLAQPAPQPKEQHSPLEPMASPKQASRSAEKASERLSLAEDYCASIADAAADARFAWQKRTLSEMEKELEQRIVILEKRTAEYREWLARRDAFVKKAQESLVRIYTRMRPDAAASQLAAMDEETAAAVLTKLNPRNASAILNEMPPGPAARLTMTLAGAAKVPPEESSAPAARGGRS